MENKYTGDAQVILGAAMWGCIGLFTRIMFEIGFSTLQVIAVRAIFTSIIMLCVICFSDIKLLKFSFKDIWMFLGTGLCSFLFFNICYMNSMKHNSLSVACILMYTSPIWVTALSAFLFKEKLTLKKVLSLVLCVGGTALTCLNSRIEMTPAGLVYGLFSGIGYALYSIFGKYAARKYHSFTITFYTFVFASFGAIPFCKAYILCGMLTDYKNMLLSVGIALLITVVPYVLYTNGLSKTSAAKAAVLAIVEPVVATVVGVVVYSEPASFAGILGIIIVAVGLLYLQHGSKGEEK